MFNRYINTLMGGLMSSTKRIMYIAAGGSLGLMFLFFILMVNTQKSLFMTLGITAMTICYHFTVRLAVGNITGSIKTKHFDPRSTRFRERRFERRLYKLLRVKKWKRLMPSYDETQFSLKDHTPDEIARITCRNETVHWLCAAASLASITFALMFGSLAVFIITGVLGALFDFSFVIVQRFNRPRLRRFGERLIDRE